MKKLLLFLSASFFAYTAMSASVAVSVTEAVFNSNVGDGYSNYQAEVPLSSVLTGALAAEDVIQVSLSGEISAAIEGLQAVVVDCDETVGYYKLISEYVSIENSAAESGASIDVSAEIVLSDASTNTNVKVFVITTNAVVDGITSITLGSVEAPYVDPVLGTAVSIWGDGNEVQGKNFIFGTAGTGIGFANYSGGFDLSEYASCKVTLTSYPEDTWVKLNIIPSSEDDEVPEVTFENNAFAVDLSNLTGTVTQFYLQCGAAGTVAIESIAFSTEAFPEEEPSEDAPYVDPVLGTATNIWGDDNEVQGKNFIFGTAETGIGFANYSGGFDLSEYTSCTITLASYPEDTWLSVNVIPVSTDDEAPKATFENNTFVIDLSTLTGNVSQLYIQCGAVGTVTIESITFSTESSGGEETAVSEISPKNFAVDRGVVKSSGEIVVYNVLGSRVATAQNVLDVSTLASGFFIITAPEGVIKIQK